MTSLRKDARGQPCLLRVPGVCSHDPSQVVLCHVRLIGVSGMGFKGEDLLGSFGCTPCHQVCDGQVASEFTYEQRRLMLLEGMMRTQAQWIKRGIVKW